MSGSVISITYDESGPDSQDISNNVLYASASFEMQMNAVPGTFSFRVRDEEQTLNFVTGREIRLYVDGIPMFGGYIRRIGHTYMFPADDTSDPEAYTKRAWQIEGVDYNILFDSLILRNTSNYLGHIPTNGLPGTTQDGDAIKTMLSTYCDFPAGFDTSEIDNISTVQLYDTSKPWYFMAQATPLRKQLEGMASMRAATFYITPDKKIHYHAYETLRQRWGFSDTPNWNAILGTSADFVAPMASWGFHEVAGEEDGTLIVNDVIIWGGSEWAGAGKTVVARYQDEVGSLTSNSSEYIQHGTVAGGSSIDLHGRWQFAETRFQELGTLNLVKARGDSVINGPPGADQYGQQKGLRYPQWVFAFDWLSNMVPVLGGQPNHILPGSIVPIDLETFGVNEIMPCRTMRITFPGLAEDGTGYASIHGEFSLSYTDPIALWTAIGNARASTPIIGIGVVTDDSTSATYGDLGSFTHALETPNGIITEFHLPGGFGYVYQTLEISLNGLSQRRGTDYLETDPDAGMFTMTSAPVTGDKIGIVCRMLSYNP